MTFTTATRQGSNQYYEEVLAEGVLPLRMMLIPAGKFLMGSPADELYRSDAEGPQHLVTLSQFFIAKYPVTQTQWQAVAAMPQVNRELAANPSHFRGDRLPVEQVSWYDAVEFCDRLNRFVENRLTLHTNCQYRLPTEAEWEYACRAGTTTPFHYGETITTELANYQGTDNQEYKWSGSYGDGPKGEYREKTTSVDQFESPNAYGLCDTHGNVWEWCQDYWHDNYDNVPTDGQAWLTDDDAATRVLRGGSWSHIPGLCRSASRSDFGPDDGYYFIGFRVSCVAPRTL